MDNQTPKFLQRGYSIPAKRNAVLSMHEMYMSCYRRCTCRATGDVHVVQQEMYMSCKEKPVFLQRSNEDTLYKIQRYNKLHSATC